MIDFDAASARLVEYLARCGSKDEADISMDREDHYKPMYRVDSWVSSLASWCSRKTCGV